MFSPGQPVICTTDEPWTTLCGNYPTPGPKLNEACTVKDIVWCGGVTGQSSGEEWLNLCEYPGRAYDALYFRSIEDWQIEGLKKIAQIEPAVEPEYEHVPRT